MKWKGKTANWKNLQKNGKEGIRTRQGFGKLTTELPNCTICFCPTIQGLIVKVPFFGSNSVSGVLAIGKDPVYLCLKSIVYKNDLQGFMRCCCSTAAAVP